MDNAVADTYNGIKSKEILPFVAAWMNLEGIIPSD